MHTVLIIFSDSMSKSGHCESVVVKGKKFTYMIEIVCQGLLLLCCYHFRYPLSLLPHYPMPEISNADRRALKHQICAYSWFT